MDTALAARLAQICGADSVITDPQELRTYECDGLTAHRCSPGMVVLPALPSRWPRSWANAQPAGIPFVARGSGTGLSGGALPRADGVLIVTSKMRSIIAIDPGQPPGDRRARRHEPGRQQGRRAVRAVLRARPVQPGRLLRRRQRGRELRRCALPQARVHRPSRHRPADRDPSRRADLARRRDRRGARLRPASARSPARRARSASSRRSSSS